MTAWTPDTCLAVLRLGMQIGADVTVPRELVASRMCHEFTAYTHAQLGVTLDPRDIAITEAADSPPPFRFVRTLQARWAPDTRSVELVGGPEDGRQIDWYRDPNPSIRRPDHLIRIPVINHNPATAPGTEFPVSRAQVARYEWSSWSPDARRWTYQFAGLS